MADQLTLFGARPAPPPPPVIPPTGWADTSKAAAREIAEHAPAEREQVFGFIAARGTTGATIEEIADGTGLGQSSVCPRIDELARPKPGRGPARIADSGMRRPTKKGRTAKVWVALPQASAASHDND